MEKCLPQVQACRIRVTRLDRNGVPTPGATSMIVSKALTSVGFAWEVEDGDEVVEKNACGELIVNFKEPTNLKRGTLTVAMVTPDPYLDEMFTRGVLLSLGAQDPPGYGAPALGQIDPDDAVSVEVWAKRMLGGKPDPDYPYAWWVYPWVGNLRPDDHEHNSGNMPRTVIGDALENENWFDGPLNDWPAASDRVFQWVPTRTLPDVACGYQTVAAS